ncbi:MAG: class I SAM-dependent rRNA methyltransferase [Desulfovibrionaceae bacterium]|nr:class I SAM-dependent rRNA methyltransferase [Desulfovibrionaceae bacterium]
MKILKLRRSEDRRIRAGHLWVFSNEVDTAHTPLTAFEPGEEAAVTDARGAFLGSACVNPHSLICARVYSREKRPLDADLLRERLTDALSLRERLFDSPYFRLAFGEGDFLPGLVVDRYGSHLACQVTTLAMERRRDLVRGILDELVHPASVLWDDTAGSRVLEGLETGGRVFEGPVPEELEVLENGCVYLVPGREGQKTGWFYDQRDNHRLTASLCRGRDVLDAFSYAGGFGVAAARAGASSVVYLDASAKALSFAERNHRANSGGGCETVCGDAFDALKELRDAGRTFDVVSIDPPAFIKRRRDYKEGLNAYRRLNYLGMQLVRDGGLLVTSSCSQLLSADDLRGCVSQASARLGALPRLLAAGRQGPDHPVHCAMPETAYLKCLIVQCARQARPHNRPGRDDTQQGQQQ